MSTKQMKFRVNGIAHSREIQEALFKDGHTWAGCTYSALQQQDRPFLFLESDGKIRYCDSESFFLSHEAQEMIVLVKTVYEFEEVVELEYEPETIELGGKIYLKAELEAALAKLTPIKE